MGLQDVQTDAAVAVDVGVVNFGCESHLQRQETSSEIGNRGALDSVSGKGTEGGRRGCCWLHGPR